MFFNFFFMSDTFPCRILGPLVPLFWISGDVSSGFQRQRGFCFLRFVQMNVVYRDPPLVLHLPTSWWPAWQPVTSPHVFQQSQDAILRIKWATTYTEDESSTIVQAMQLAHVDVSCLSYLSSKIIVHNRTHYVPAWNKIGIQKRVNISRYLKLKVPTITNTHRERDTGGSQVCDVKSFPLQLITH